MKKFVFLLHVSVFSIGMLSAQIEIAVSIDNLPTSGLTPGDLVNVNVNCDNIVYNGTNYVKSAQLFITFDPAVLTPQLGPFGQYFDNLNFYFLSVGSIPQTNVPNPGDWRMVFFTTSRTGIHITPGSVMFSLPFIWNGGDSPLDWGLTAKLVPVIDGQAGGKLAKGVTMFTDWTDAVFPFSPGNPVNGCVGTCGVTAITWTGAVDNDWFNTGNWYSGTVPTATDDVVIPVTANDPMLSGFGECNAMQTDPGATVNVGVGPGALTTHGLLTNDGMLFVDGTVPGGISGSFIDMGGMAGAGSFEMDQDVAGLTAPAADPTGWHYISAPVNGFTSDDMWDYFLNTWDEPTSMWVQHTGNPSIPCDPAPTVAMNSMDAWSVKNDVVWPGVDNCPGGTGPVVEFMAATMADVHTGAYGPAAGTFTAGAFAGWNMFGNPYPSSIDPGLITWDANMNQSVYYWDGYANTYVSWAGGVGSVIPPTQGFFTSSTAASSMSFAGTERIHGGDWFWKSEISNLLELEVTAADNDYHDVSYVRFTNDASLGFDKVWDAYKLMSYVPGVPQIYTTNGSDKLSINAQQETETVPMNFESVESGTFTIAAIKANDMTTVLLEDTFTGDITDMMTSSYTFDHTAGAPADRFIIHFAPLGVNELNADNVNIWSSENNIYVKVPSSINGDIVVYNLMGQEVVRTDIAPGLNTIPMDHVNANYVVKVLTDDNAVTGKVYIK